MASSSSQEDAFHDMREQYPALTDATLRRFLKARKYDVAATKEMLDAFLVWRRKVGEVNINDSMEEVRKGMFHFHGRARDGSPVVVVYPARFFPKTTDFRALIRLCIWAMECMMAANPETETFTVLVDYTDLGLKNVDRNFTKTLAEVYLSYYPEVLRQEMIVNTPWIFRSLWAWVKTWLDAETQKKIRLLPSDFAPVLREAVAPSDLLPRFGGESRWQQPDCSPATAADISHFIGDFSPCPDPDRTPMPLPILSPYDENFTLRHDPSQEEEEEVEEEVEEEEEEEAVALSVEGEGPNHVEEGAEEYVIMSLATGLREGGGAAVSALPPPPDWEDDHGGASAEDSDIIASSDASSPPPALFLEEDEVEGQQAAAATDGDGSHHGKQGGEGPHGGQAGDGAAAAAAAGAASATGGVVARGTDGVEGGNDKKTEVVEGRKRAGTGWEGRARERLRSVFGKRYGGEEVERKVLCYLRERTSRGDLFLTGKALYFHSEMFGGRVAEVVPLSRVEEVGEVPRTRSLRVKVKGGDELFFGGISPFELTDVVNVVSTLHQRIHHPPSISSSSSSVASSSVAAAASSSTTTASSGLKTGLSAPSVKLSSTNGADVEAQVLEHHDDVHDDVHDDDVGKSLAEMGAVSAPSVVMELSEHSDDKQTDVNGSLPGVGGASAAGVVASGAAGGGVRQRKKQPVADIQPKPKPVVEDDDDDPFFGLSKRGGKQGSGHAAGKSAAAAAAGPEQQWAREAGERAAAVAKMSTAFLTLFCAFLAWAWAAMTLSQQQEADYFLWVRVAFVVASWELQWVQGAVDTLKPICALAAFRILPGGRDVAVAEFVGRSQAPLLVRPALHLLLMQLLLPWLCPEFPLPTEAFPLFLSALSTAFIGTVMRLLLEAVHLVPRL